MKALFSLGASTIWSPLSAVAIYLAIVVAMLFVMVSSVAGMIDRRSDVAAASATLERLEGSRPVIGSAPGDAMPLGSPYLEGATVTIAGATLLQRVAGSVMSFGGNVLSTQLDVPSSPGRSGFVSMIANCEVDQPQLQQVLYDLEAGMPFLFIDQLVVQAPAAGPGNKLRIRLAVSGQWRGAK